MFYCGRCKIVFECHENTCKLCGKRRLKEPAPADIVFLTRRNSAPLAGMLEDILTQNEIPFLRQEAPGKIPMAVFGVAFYFDYYVHFGNLEKAKELNELLPK